MEKTRAPAYRDNTRLHDFLRRYHPSELKVVRVSLRSGEENYVMPKRDYEARHDREGLPLMFNSAVNGGDSQVKKGIGNMVSYVRSEGVPISVDEDTWEALNFPVPAFLIARHIE